MDRMSLMQLLTISLTVVIWVGCVYTDASGTVDRRGIRSRRFANGAKCGLMAEGQSVAVLSVENSTQSDDGNSEDKMLDDSQGGRLTGGMTAVTKWPWMARFTLTGRHVCGGSVIDEKHVITAAHCFADIRSNKRQWSVMIGELSRSKDSSSYYPIDEFKLHENYTGLPDLFNDIAIVRLQTALPPAFMPICLPTKDTLQVGDNMSILGWGRTSKGGSYATVLQEIHDVAVRKNAHCEEIIKKLNNQQKYLMKNQFCSGNPEGGKGACEGDSGGPVMSQNIDGQYVLEGVVSYGYQCGMPKISGVYTRVYFHLKWIQRFIEEGKIGGQNGNSGEYVGQAGGQVKGGENEGEGGGEDIGGENVGQAGGQDNGGENEGEAGGEDIRGENVGKTGGENEGKAGGQDNVGENEGEAGEKGNGGENVEQAGGQDNGGEKEGKAGEDNGGENEGEAGAEDNGGENEGEAGGQNNGLQNERKAGGDYV